jgi:restriction system protein
MNPMVVALKKLGGSASIAELDQAIAKEMNLSDEQLAVPHDPEAPGKSETSYRMAWTRTYLGKAGLLENSERGVWALTPDGRERQVRPADIVRQVRAMSGANRGGEDLGEEDGSKGIGGATESENLLPTQVADDWRSKTMLKLLNISSDAFERLCMRVLRESGFVEVKVTGRRGDGGIDGVGIFRLQRVVSFQVLIQCKRWKGSVGAGEIRDFRGAMIGRSDKGLFMTTGTFAKGAREEAVRDGAPPIDLIDGDQLVD